MKEGIVQELTQSLKESQPSSAQAEETNLIISIISHLQRTNRHCTVCQDPGCTGFAHTSGTPGFRAPEVLTKVIHQTSALDIWSCGIIFMCVLSRRYPLFYQKSNLNEYCELMECCSFFGSEIMMNGLAEMNRRVENIPYVQPAPLRELFVHSHWEEWMVDVAMDLLMKMLEVNPAKRVTADEALKHPFFFMFFVFSEQINAGSVHPSGLSTGVVLERSLISSFGKIEYLGNHQVFSENHR